MINGCILQFIKYPHTYSFFVLEKESMQTESETDKYTGQKLFILIKIKTCVSCDCEYTCPFKPESNLKPLSCEFNLSAVSLSRVSHSKLQSI